MRSFTYLICALVLLSCAPIRTLNTKNHNFGVAPKKIVWIQVAGLSEEHLPLLKFSLPSNRSRLAIEQMTCFGKTWSYNLFDIRPSAFHSFQTQITGRKNMRKQCDSFSLRPIWSLLAENNYQSLVMESGAKKNSITKVLSCQEEERTPWLDDTVLLKIERAPGHKDLRFFHAKEKTTYELGRPYYDKACSARGCYNPLSVNFVAAYEKFFASKSKAFFLLRDFSFQEYLQRGELLKVKDVLMEIDKIIGYLNEQSQGQADFLILVTSAATLPVEYPLQGNNWATLEQKGIGLLYKKQALMSPLFVFGARAENFCGVYEDAQIIERLNKDSKKKGIEITIRNPFK